MNYTVVAALAIFAFTLVLMIKRPRGLRLGYAAGIGAAASLLLGSTPSDQHVRAGPKRIDGHGGRGERQNNSRLTP